MVLESAEHKSCIRLLEQINFELAYLALLTTEGLKPLSRWEKSLARDGLDSLQRLALSTSQIRRTVKTGSEVIETIFSRSAAYIRLYEQRFAGTPIDKSTQTQRFEGFVFGYPPCCIEQYIRKPYAPNNLPKEDQEILFHWACNDCKITPILLPTYRELYNLLHSY